MYNKMYVVRVRQTTVFYNCVEQEGSGVLLAIRGRVVLELVYMYKGMQAVLQADEEKIPRYPGVA